MRATFKKPDGEHRELPPTSGSHGHAIRGDTWTTLREREKRIKAGSVNDAR
jgi:hypothetical protein